MVIVIVSLLWWYFRLREQENLPKLINWFLLITERKPFNCEFCLSLWVGVIFSYLFDDVYILTLPILYELVRRILIRI